MKIKINVHRVSKEETRSGLSEVKWIAGNIESVAIAHMHTY